MRELQQIKVSEHQKFNMQPKKIATFKPLKSFHVIGTHTFRQNQQSFQIIFSKQQHKKTTIQKYE